MKGTNTMATARAFLLGFVFGIMFNILLRSVSRGFITFLTYRRMERLVSLDELDDKLANGGRLVIVTCNMIFNGIYLRPDEDWIADWRKDGLMINKIRVSESFLKRRFPAAEIRIVDPFYFD